MSDPAKTPGSLVLNRLPIGLVALLLAFTLCIGLFMGYAAGIIFRPTAAACPDSADTCAEFAALIQVWELAHDQFVDAEAIDNQRMLDGAINGMLDTLGDQGHTRYLSAAETAEWEESLQGSFEGIGAYIDVRDGQTMIVSPIEGSPAEGAGLRPGDMILLVDGDTTENWTVEELATRIRGPAGSTVTLQILHMGEELPFEVTITRAKVIVPSVSWRMLPENIALVRLVSFDRNASDQMQTALNAAQAAGARAVILDLRNNPGGILQEAVQIASQFLPADMPVLLEEDRDGERQTTTTVDGGVALDIPLVVLINQRSASSAEILSGALQDAKRATLVGETTFGTGTVLTPYAIDGGGRLLLGTLQWLTPTGRLIRGQGILPDEEVSLPLDGIPLTPAEAAELSQDQLNTSSDSQLIRALELAIQAAKP